MLKRALCRDFQCLRKQTTSTNVKVHVDSKCSEKVKTVKYDENIFLKTSFEFMRNIPVPILFYHQEIERVNGIPINLISFGRN